MFTNIIKKVYDLHFHIGPEIIPRKYSIFSLVEEEKGRIKGIGIKNHMFTPAFSQTDQKNNSPIILYSLTLNHYIGGINPFQVEASFKICPGKLIVRFPTLHATSHLKNNLYEIPQERINNDIQAPRLSKEIVPIKIRNNGILTKETCTILELIKFYDGILATGHLSFTETKTLVEEANKMGIKRIIITHPIYHIQNFSVQQQQYLVSLGAMIEMTEAMYSIDKIPLRRIVDQVKQIGPKNFILTSDGGQIYSKSPSIILNTFCNLLYTSGISKEEIEMMLLNSVKMVE